MILTLSYSFNVTQWTDLFHRTFRQFNDIYVAFLIVFRKLNEAKNCSWKHTRKSFRLRCLKCVFCGCSAAKITCMNYFVSESFAIESVFVSLWIYAAERMLQWLCNGRWDHRDFSIKIAFFLFIEQLKSCKNGQSVSTMVVFLCLSIVTSVNSRLSSIELAPELIT